MAAVTIRNLAPATHRALKYRAKAKGRSTEAEIRSILDEAVKPPEGQVGLGTALRNWAIEHLHGEELVIERDMRPAGETVSFE